MVARRARGGALSRAPRTVVVILALLGAVLITPAPAAPLGVMAIVGQKKMACQPVWASVYTDEGRGIYRRS